MAPLTSGGIFASSASKGGVPPFSERQRRNWFPERAGSARYCGSRLEPRGRSAVGGVGSLGAFRGAELLSRAMGRFACPHSSASIASRVQVRATSRRISRTRELGAASAHCRHSAARSLHFSGLSITIPKRGPPILKIKPRVDRGDQRGFLRSASAGAKLFSKLGTYLIVPRHSRDQELLRVRPVFCCLASR